MVHRIRLRDEKELGFGLQESFVVANIHRVVGGLSGALGRVRKVFEEAEEGGHAVEGCGEGNKSNDDVRSVGSALNLESCEKCHNIIMSCFVG